jgi:tetratricopeptide (TPR) repeat protein
MAWDDVLFGRQTYSDWIQAQDIGRNVGHEISSLHTSTQATLTNVTRVAQVGLGAVENLGRDLRGTLSNLGLELGNLGDGIAALNADFNLRLTEMVWQAQQQNEKLDRLLYASENPETIRAYEKRSRGRFAHSSELWEDAKRNYEESLTLNEFDFTVHRSLGDLYLLHFSDPETAFGYYNSAARYARPHSISIAAENSYMAGTAAAIRQKREEALRLFEEALQLLPSFADAAYQAACLASLLQEPEKLVRHLEQAISIDGRYLDRARESQIFVPYRSLVASRLTAIIVHERLVTELACTRLLAVAEGVDDLTLGISTQSVREWARTTLSTANQETVANLRKLRADASERVQDLYAKVCASANRERSEKEIEIRRIESERLTQIERCETPVHEAELELAEFRERSKPKLWQLVLLCVLVYWVESSIVLLLVVEILAEETSQQNFYLIVGGAIGVGVVTVIAIWWWRIRRYREGQVQRTQAVQLAQHTQAEIVGRIQKSYSERLNHCKEGIHRLDRILQDYAHVPRSNLN